MFNLKKTFAVAALAAVSTLNVANAGVLDTFEYTPEVVLSQNVVGFDDQTVSVTPAGSVTYTLTVQETNVFPGTSSAASDANIADGYLSYDATSTIASTLDADYAFASTDITDAGTSTAFYIDVFAATEGFDAEITLTDSSNATSTATLSVAAMGLSFPASRQWVSFNQFSGLADFSSIVGLEINYIAGALGGVNGDNYFGGDLTIGEIGTVPEPTSLAILGLGLLGFAASRKKSA